MKLIRDAKQVVRMYIWENAEVFVGMSRCHLVILKIAMIISYLHGYYLASFRWHLYLIRSGFDREKAYEKLKKKEKCK